MSDIYAERTAAIFQDELQGAHVRIDRMFATLMVVQWLAGIGVAFWLAPLSWVGRHSYMNPTVPFSLCLGAVIAALPIIFALSRPGRFSTRCVIAVAQMSYSALLIHLTGGRIETHFHVFGSLAFLAFYRDWRVLVPATLVIAADHFVRGIFWPESVFGVASSGFYRALEHAGWVLFIDVFLAWSCVVSLADVRKLARQQAQLEDTNFRVFNEVNLQTKAVKEQAWELRRGLEERKKMESQLLHAQKMESIGQLAAGIAHEINTPAQYVTDNTRFLQENFDSVLQLIRMYDEYLNCESPPKSWNDRRRVLSAQRKKIDYEFLAAEIPNALNQSLEGLDRINHIVGAMKSFSHPGSETKEHADINAAIQSTVAVSRARWKYVADLELHLDSQLPQVPVLLNEFNQVILNLIVNAADALAESAAARNNNKGLITISTRSDGDYAIIKVADNGPGIPEEFQHKIFDPFFTTKEVGKGTGQGLTISHSTIVEKHGGELTFATKGGEGTTFFIRLPLHAAQANSSRTEERQLCSASA